MLGLIIDDNNGDLCLAQSTFSESNVLTHTDTGETWREKVLANTYDFILVDLYLHQANGFDVAEEAKLLSPSSCVVLNTCLSSNKSISESYRKNIDLYVTKPVSESLVEHLKGVCNA